MDGKAAGQPVLATAGSTGSTAKTDDQYNQRWPASPPLS